MSKPRIRDTKLRKKARESDLPPSGDHVPEEDFTTRGTPRVSNNGRKQKTIDYELVEKLAGIHCTVEEIAEMCGCSVDTLRRRAEAMEAMAKGRAVGRASLRRLQFDTARRGNATMQIWLGKQILGQKDKTEDITGGMSEDELRERILLDLKTMDNSIPGFEIEDNSDLALPAPEEK